MIEQIVFEIFNMNKVTSNNLDQAEKWYIQKQEIGTCLIISDQKISDQSEQQLEIWGPFASQSEAIAKRVGLIRAGKCQPLTST